MVCALAEEWNAAQVVSKVTAPEIKTRAGRIIEPIQLSKGKKRTEADTSAGTSGAKRPRKQ